MPRIDFGINLDTAREAGLVEGFSNYEGPTPPAGSYRGILKVLRLKKITKAGANQGKSRLQIGVEIKHPEYDGFFLWGGLNLINEPTSLGFVNQFLNSLGDGSEASLLKKQKAMFGPGPDVDDSGINVEVLKIGDALIDSPNGERPILITIKKNRYKVTDDDGNEIWKENMQISGYMPPGGETSNSSATAEGSDVEEETGPAVEVETESATEPVAEPVAEEGADESVFDA